MTALTGLSHDLRFALRQLSSRRVGSLVAILTLALAIGGTTAIYSVVHGVLLAPLPYPDAQELMILWESDEARGRDRSSVSPVNLRDWRRENRSFTDLVALDTASFNLAGDDQAEPERLLGARVSAGFFDVLGRPPVLGRPFLPEEDAVDAEPVAVVSHDLWRDRFDADETVVGTTVEIGGTATRIVGVAAPGFSFPTGTRLWVPAAFDWSQAGRDERWVVGLGRLQPGVTRQTAEADLDRIAATLADAYPATNTGRGVTVLSLREALVGDVAPILWRLLAAVGLVLLVACANVANLSLAGLARRRREVAVRRAVGAGDARLVRQLLTESLLLALFGAGLGVLLATWGTTALVARFADALPPARQVTVNPQVLLFTLVVTVGCGALFGLAPALRIRSKGASTPLVGGVRGIPGGGSDHRLRRWLVAAEVALALVLLVGAGLLTKSLDRLLAADTGFDPSGKVSLRAQLPSGTHPDDVHLAAFAVQLLDEARARPGVDRAAVASALPLSGSRTVYAFLFEGQPVPERNNQWPVAEIRRASDGYFDVMGIPVLRGRPVEATDGADALPVAVVNEAFVREYLPGADPIGRTLSFGDPRDDEEDTYRRIVGVVGDVRFVELGRRPGPELYLPFQQLPTRSLTLVAEARRGAPAALVPELRTAFRTVDPTLPVFEAHSLSQLVRRSVDRPRMAATLVGLFSLMALALAAVGVYGVLASTLGQRRSELGVRMALGSSRRRLTVLLARQGLRPVLAGLAAGSLGAIAFARLLADQLYDIAPLDPTTYLQVTGLLLAVAVVAVLVPAGRAARLDPAQVLRDE